MKPESLPRTRRMRRRVEFERAYTAGVRVHGRFLTLFVVPNGREVSRLGVAATRKLGASVERNRAKRLAREVFRRHTTTSGLDIVIVPRRELLDAPFATLEADYLGALGRRSTARPADRSRGRPRGARPAPRV